MTWLDQIAATCRQWQGAHPGEQPLVAEYGYGTPGVLQAIRESLGRPDMVILLLAPTDDWPDADTAARAFRETVQDFVDSRIILTMPLDLVVVAHPYTTAPGWAEDCARLQGCLAPDGRLLIEDAP